MFRYKPITYDLASKLRNTVKDDQDIPIYSLEDLC